MASNLDELLPAIVGAGDAGLTLAKIAKKFAGTSKAKEPLEKKLAELADGGAIWGPLKRGGSRYYFAAGRGPSIETASAAVSESVSRSGVKLLSKPGLEKKVTGMDRQFLADGLKHAIASQAILELSCGRSKFYLHRDVAADRFGFAAVPPEPADASLTFENLLPVYRRLVAEQGGFSAVNIYDLMEGMKASKEALHGLLREEARIGRVTLHPTTSVDLPKAVTDAGMRLPGSKELYITVVVENEQ